ncbi:MAG: FtsX-like permease family protein [Gammaproteobacteria bacterium]|nr:FtsX-like permease family protein [Gammaproteobacteria bacterium]MBU1414839.1 FtsX-like permease family protein [Gammaproteobacteria bacterium]
MLVRDWRAGELTVLGLALVLAVAALSSVSFLADRVQQGIVLHSHQLLGGDMLLSADHKWSDDFRQAALRDGLQLAESASFISMVSGGEATQLAEVKAVSDNFPLRGALRIAPTLNAPDEETQRVPASGESWPDERLAHILGTEGVKLGALESRVGAVLTMDPDRGINAFSLAPRMLVNLVDLPATQLIQPGSRVTWRLHVAGEAKALERFRRWATARLGRGERLESLDNARPEVRNLLERAGRFLRLAALLTVVLAAVAVGLTSDRYLRRHLDGCAVMRCLGASSGRILAIHGGEFILFGLSATLLGCALGYGAQLALQFALSGLLGAELPLPSWRPWAHGSIVGLVLVAGFVLPPLLRLRRVPTVRVLRREWNAAEPRLLAAYGFGVMLLVLLMVWVAGELKLGAIVVGGFAVAVLVYGGIGRALLVMGRRRTGAAFDPWRLGLANLRRRWRDTVIQAVALGLGLTTLLVLTIARGDLMESWKAKVPMDAPNRFVINLQPDQREAFSRFFGEHGLPPPVTEPMVRGRLTAVNSQPRRHADYADERARRLMEREFNLSWTSELPTGNTVVAGRWYGSDSSPQFSVEQGLAETLGLAVGDDLTFEVAGVPLSARVTSLRKLDWDSMRVNFFVVAPPGLLEGYPASYITSFHLPSGRGSLVTDLVRAFPNITVIDVAAVIRQLQDSFDQVARAVQALFGLALVAGLIVLYAALQAGFDERQRELAVMRALGARQRQLRQVLLAEFAALGTVSGLLAGMGAAGIAWALATFVFRLDYLPSPWLPIVGMVAGTVGVIFAGMSATRDMLRKPVSAQLLAS